MVQYQKLTHLPTFCELVVREAFSYIWSRYQRSDGHTVTCFALASKSSIDRAPTSHTTVAALKLRFHWRVSEARGCLCGDTSQPTSQATGGEEPSTRFFSSKFHWVEVVVERRRWWRPLWRLSPPLFQWEPTPGSSNTLIHTWHWELYCSSKLFSRFWPKGMVAHVLCCGQLKNICWFCSWE